jgi:hypothetical protein
MGTSTTARGAMAIPGEVEADYIFTAGLRQSRLFFDLNPHFPLLPSPLSCALKKFKGHHHELLHYYSLIHYFTSRTHEMK